MSNPLESKEQEALKKNYESFHEQTLLVTGGAGMIGSNLIKFLNEIGHKGKIYVADDLGEDEKWLNLRDLSFADFIPKDQLFEKFPLLQPEITFHLGACSATTMKDGDFLIKNNYQYSQKLYQAYRELKSFQNQNDPYAWNGPRFVYASSAATYGLGEQGFSDNDFNSCRPLNLYGYSKHLFDLYLGQMGAFENSFCVGIKYFNIYGPREFHKGDMRSVVLKAVESIQNTGKIQLFQSHHVDFGNGEQKRDFLYVKDAVFLTYLLAISPMRLGGVFNVGSGKAETFNSLAFAVFQALGRRPNIEYIPMPVHLGSKYQNFTQAEMQKTLHLINRHSLNPLVKNLEAYPKYSLEEGVKDYIQKHLVQPVAEQGQFAAYLH